MLIQSSDYELGDDGVCYRTTAAIRAKLTTTEEWQRFIQGLEDDRQSQEQDQMALAMVCNKILEPLAQKVADALGAIQKQLDRCGTDTNNAVLVAKRRWEQMERLTNGAIEMYKRS